jgi:hypothetical protein
MPRCHPRSLSNWTKKGEAFKRFDMRPPHFSLDRELAGYTGLAIPEEDDVFSPPGYTGIAP